MTIMHVQAIAEELEETLKLRRKELQAAKARRMQSTAENRQLHQRAISATDALLLCVKQARDRWQAACTAPAAAAPLDPPPFVTGSDPSSRDTSRAPEPPLQRGASTTIKTLDELGAAACMQPLRPSDVLPDPASAAACIGGHGPLPAAVAAVDIQTAERMVQDVGLKLATLRVHAGQRARVDAGVVQWLLQTPYTTARGETLSFGIAQAAGPCCASRHAFSLLLQLETCFLMAVVDPCLALVPSTPIGMRQGACTECHIEYVL